MNPGEGFRESMMLFEVRIGAQLLASSHQVVVESGDVAIQTDRGVIFVDGLRRIKLKAATFADGVSYFLYNSHVEKCQVTIDVQHKGTSIGGGTGLLLHVGMVGEEVVGFEFASNELTLRVETDRLRGRP